MSRQQSGEAWENKLKGKTLLLDGAETTLGAEEVFWARDLPEGYRILPPGAIQTRDYRPDRLNVFVTKDYKVERAYFS